jgi:hypothetical protein
LLHQLQGQAAHGVAWVNLHDGFEPAAPLGRAIDEGINSHRPDKAGTLQLGFEQRKDVAIEALEAARNVSRFLPDRFYSIPHHDYWFDPARRPVTLAYVLRHSLWFSSMALCFVTGIHALIIHANSLAQPHFSTVQTLALAACFLAGTAIWAVNLFRHFKHVASEQAL